MSQKPQAIGEKYKDNELFLAIMLNAEATKGLLRLVTAEEAEAAGFTVDRSCSPCVGYKGARFSPYEVVPVATDAEAALCIFLANVCRIEDSNIVADLITQAELVAAKTEKSQPALALLLTRLVLWIERMAAQNFVLDREIESLEETVHVLEHSLTENDNAAPSSRH